MPSHSEYVHNGVYVYDATSQTFQPYASDNVIVHEMVELHRERKRQVHGERVEARQRERRVPPCSGHDAQQVRDEVSD